MPSRQHFHPTSPQEYMIELILCVIYNTAAKVAEVVDRVGLEPHGETVTAEEVMQIYFNNMFSGSHHSRFAKSIIKNDDLRDSLQKLYLRNCDTIHRAKKHPCTLVPSRDGTLKPMRPKHQQDLMPVRPRRQQDYQRNHQHDRPHVHRPGHQQGHWQDYWLDYWHADARRRPRDAWW